jgi:hypothetical protein
MHQLPHGLQEFSVVCLFIIQLRTVFFIFGPRRTPYMGCAVQVFLDVMIGLNGNYGLFNLLSVALCFLLLDDSIF